MKRIVPLLVACAACAGTLFASGPGKGKVLTLIKDGDHRLSRDSDLALLVEAIERLSR